jgi:hypothetical protein
MLTKRRAGPKKGMFEPTQVKRTSFGSKPDEALIRQREAAGQGS